LLLAFNNLTSSAESSIFFGFQEAAYDAEKVFLAAIDKFDAMMSKGNVYAPDGEYLFFFTKSQSSYKLILEGSV